MSGKYNQCLQFPTIGGRMKINTSLSNDVLLYCSAWFNSGLKKKGRKPKRKRGLQTGAYSSLLLENLPPFV